MKYICTDGYGGELELEADSAHAAAEKFCEDWDTSGRRDTIWVDVYVTPIGDDGEPVAEREGHTITIDPEEPACACGRDHEWESPYEILGGLKENPGVQGNGGGVVITEVCANCGTYRITDTWAQRPDTGEQGLVESVEYVEADDKSLEWCLLAIRDRFEDLISEAMDVDDETHREARRIYAEIGDGQRSREEAAELFEGLSERIANAEA
jgi:hypothetical protein